MLKDVVGGVRHEYGIEPMGPIWEGRKATYTLILVQHMDESPRRKDEEADPLRSPKSKCPSGIIEQATCARRQDTKEGERDV